MILKIMYTLPFAIILMFFPQTFSPNGKMPFNLKAGTEDNNFDDMQLLIARFQAANLFNVLAYFYNFQSTPRQIKYLGRVVMLLYTFVFLKGALDTTGACNRKAYTVQLMIHLVLTVKTAQFPKKQKKSAKIATKQTQAKPVPIPDLKSEGKSHRTKEE